MRTCDEPRVEKYAASSTHVNGAEKKETVEGPQVQNGKQSMISCRQTISHSRWHEDEKGLNNRRETPNAKKNK
jgi:hypothetical protein